MESVIISITGGLPGESVEFITNGSVYDESGKRVLSFEETELSGVEGTVTRIILDAQTVSLHRMGEQESFMHFENQKHSMAEVVTPFGTSVLSVYTYDMHFEENVEGGRLDVRYLLEMDGQSSQNHIALAFKYPQQRTGGC